LKRKLQDAGFENITFLDPGVPTKVDDGISFEVIPPLNGFGQESELYVGNDSLIETTAIDTGLIITTLDYKLVFLADNTPYLYKRYLNVLTNLYSADLIAFPYNGAASDYPVCYLNIDDEEMISISNLRESRRELAFEKFFEEVKPRLLMPYSSDFAVFGKAARRFSKFSEMWWMNRSLVAERYAESTGIPAVDINGCDLLYLSKESNALEFKLTRGVDNPQSLEDFSRNLIQVPSSVDELFKYSGIDLTSLTTIAAEHMFNSIEQFKIKCDWIFLVTITDLSVDIAIDLNVASIVQSYSDDRKLLNVRLNSGYLEALLTGKAHWNNAQLSFQLEWIRTPNTYSHDLYTAINFFHAARNKS
jgi:hypothetical protein